MAKNNMLILGVAGGAAVAIYFVVKKQGQAQAATAIAQSVGVAVAEPPGLLDTFLGKIPEAVKRGDAFYATKDPAGGTQCFVVATGAKAPIAQCSGAPGMLEGYY